MVDIIEKFYTAYWGPGMQSLYTAGVSKGMMASEVDKHGWYEWKLLEGTLKAEDYRVIEKKYNSKFPEIFISWHKKYFFADGDCSIIRLPASLPNQPLEEIDRNFLYLNEGLIALGLIPFGDEGNDSGPLVFDTRQISDFNQAPIRFFNHEYWDDLTGLSEIIFSSFEKLLECVSHFLEAKRKGEQAEGILDFFQIDPQGAGSSGRKYWQTWASMMK